MTDYNCYQSPFSWRYGSNDVREIWGEYHKREIWRFLWVTLSEAQLHFGLVRPDQVKDLRDHMSDVNILQSLEFEKEIKHDLMAELMVFSEQCQIGGGIIHLGATSVDIKDNTIVLQCKESLRMILDKLESILLIFAKRVDQYADLPVMAFTHLQPAEPTTLGYRFAQYAQDLLIDWISIRRIFLDLKGKGFRGAVGTSASFAELLGVENLLEFNSILSEKLGLPFYLVTTQTYPRKQDLDILNALSGLAAGIHKFAFDLRVLQSPMIGELSEPFGIDQVGSSAMPFKRNPIHSEKIDSLARWLAQFPRTAWDNAANSLLERTLDDSANRRIILPEAFLIADELLDTLKNILEEIEVDEKSIKKTLQIFGPFAATERLLMALSKSGADRQEMHERLRKHTLRSWRSIQNGEENPLLSIVSADPIFQKYLPGRSIALLMDASTYFGDAPQRARTLAKTIREHLEEV